MDSSEKINVGRKKLTLPTVGRYKEKRLLTNIWSNSEEWLLVDRSAFDDKLYQYGGLVDLVKRDGTCIRSMGTIGRMLGHSSCACDEVIWSQKAIFLTTEAMWAEKDLEVVDKNK